MNTKESIRFGIPGGTLGCIEYDKEAKIVNLFVNPDYVVATYPEDVNEQLKVFIGQKIEF